MKRKHLYNKGDNGLSVRIVTETTLEDFNQLHSNAINKKYIYWIVVITLCAILYCA